MAFKNQKLSHFVGAVPVSIPEYKVQNVNGVSIVDVVNSDGVDDSIPKPSDYTLESLLAAGVPLDKVNPTVLSSQPSNVEDRINDIIKDDDNLNE